VTGDPRFLLEMGRTYRTSGDLPRARDSYARYMSEAPPDHPERAQAAAEQRELQPVILKPEPLRPVESSDGGRSQDEIHAALGDEAYADYLASHLTLAGYEARARGRTIALQGGGIALASMAGGLALLLSASDSARWRSVAGYTVIVIGVPIGGWMLRYGFALSTAASIQIRTPHFADGPPAGRQLGMRLSFAF
jgi:hypothetical protein